MEEETLEKEVEDDPCQAQHGDDEVSTVASRLPETPHGECHRLQQNLKFYAVEVALESELSRYLNGEQDVAECGEHGEAKQNVSTLFLFLHIPRNNQCEWVHDDQDGKGLEQRKRETAPSFLLGACSNGRDVADVAHLLERSAQRKVVEITA